MAGELLLRQGTQLQTSPPNLLVDVREKNPFNFTRFRGWFAGIEKRDLWEELVGSYRTKFSSTTGPNPTITGGSRQTTACLSFTSRIDQTSSSTAVSEIPHSFILQHLFPISSSSSAHGPEVGTYVLNCQVTSARLLSSLS